MEDENFNGGGLKMMLMDAVLGGRRERGKREICLLLSRSYVVLSANDGSIFELFY